MWYLYIVLFLMLLIIIVSRITKSPMSTWDVDTFEVFFFVTIIWSAPFIGAVLVGLLLLIEKLDNLFEGFDAFEYMTRERSFSETYDKIVKLP